MSGDVLAEQIVSGYLQQLEGWTGDLHWTWAMLDSLVRNKPEFAWPMLLELIHRAPDRNLAYLAAGPLEDFLSEHGPQVIDAVEAEATTNPRLRHALAMVWQLGMTENVWHRVQAISDPSLAAAMDAEPEDRHRSGVEVRLDRMPTFASGRIVAEDADTLLEALRASNPDEPEPWDLPVGVHLGMWTGAEALPVDAVGILAQVVELLETGRVITDRRLVREAEVREYRSAAPEFRLEVLRMPAEQVEAIDSTEPFDLELAREESQAMLAELQAARREMDSESGRR